MSQPAIPIDAAERRRNVLLITSDRPNPGMMGNGRHPDVKTPALDALVHRGTVLSSPCRCPTEGFESAPGSAAGYGEALVAAGYPVTTIGAPPAQEGAADIAFVDRRLAALRPHRSVPGEGRPLLTSVGPGESPYTRFDRAVAAAAVGFLRDEIQSAGWALIVSFASPRFPLVAPKDFFDRYDPSQLALPPRDTEASDRPWEDALPPAVESAPLTEHHQRAALHAYLALCSFLDARIGQVLQALEASGQAEDTVVVYTTDHAKVAAARGPSLERLVNDESGSVPLVAAGPGIEAGRVVESSTSHLDHSASVLEWMGASAPMGLAPVPAPRAAGVAVDRR